MLLHVTYVLHGSNFVLPHPPPSPSPVSIKNKDDAIVLEL